MKESQLRLIERLSARFFHGCEYDRLHILVRLEISLKFLQSVPAVMDDLRMSKRWIPSPDILAAKSSDLNQNSPSALRF